MSIDELFAPMTKQTRSKLYSAMWRTAVTGFIYWSLGGFASWSFPGFARAEDVQQQLQKLNEHQQSTDVSLMKLQLQSDQHALFEVQARIADKRKAGEPIDSLYYTEETRLTGEISTLEEKIRRLGN